MACYCDIGPAKRLDADAAWDELSAVSSPVFRFSTDISWTRCKCSCNPFVDPPTVFNRVLHNLHLADCPHFSRKKCQIPSFLYYIILHTAPLYCIRPTVYTIYLRPTYSLTLYYRLTIANYDGRHWQAHMALYSGLSEHPDAITSHAQDMDMPCMLSAQSPALLAAAASSAVSSRQTLLQVAAISRSLYHWRLFTSWLVVTAVPVCPGIWTFSFLGIREWKSPGIPGTRETGTREWIPYLEITFVKIYKRW